MAPQQVQGLLGPDGPVLPVARMKGVTTWWFTAPEPPTADPVLRVDGTARRGPVERQTHRGGEPDVLLDAERGVPAS